MSHVHTLMRYTVDALLWTLLKAACLLLRGRHAPRQPIENRRITSSATRHDATPIVPPGISLRATHRFGAHPRNHRARERPQARKMLFTNLTSVRTARSAGRFATFAATFALGALVATAACAQNPAPGTAPMQQPSSSSADGQTSTTQAAPGTAPMATHRAAVALAPGRGPSYHNKWDIYGGLSFMNGQAGQDLPKRYNMGGGEAQATYWLGSRLGIAADYRFEAGTTPVLPNHYYNRVLVMQHIFAGGVQYRGPKNHYVAINYHAFAGAADGIFDHAVQNYPGGSPIAACPTEATGSQGNIGLYCNHVAPWGAAGGSIDFNQGPKLAIRLSPDMIFEHFGTETREYVSISLGVLYRFGRH